MSTEEQKENKRSLLVQREAAISLAAEKGLYLDESMIFEESRPASKVYLDDEDEQFDLLKHLEKRPVLKKIVDLASERKINHLIIYTRDRLSRHLETSLALFHHFKKNNVKIHFSSTGEGINILDDKISRFIEIILANVAELEANTLAIRSRAGARMCVKKGYWPGGKAPFGYMRVKAEESVKNNTRLKPVEYEKEVVQQVFDYYNSGYGYREIAELMNRQQKSCGKWTKSRVESIIKNETYTGYIVWGRRGGRRHPGKRESYEKSPEPNNDAVIIEENQWNDILNIRSNKNKDPKYYATEYLLKGKLVCGMCGKLLKTKNYGNNKSRVYRCPTLSDKGISELIINKDEVEEKFIKEFIERVEHGDYKVLWDTYREEALKFEKRIQTEIEAQQQRLNEIQPKLEEISKLMVRNLSEEIKTFLDMRYAELIRLKESIEKEQNENKNKLGKRYSYAEFVENLNRLFKDFMFLPPKMQRMMIDISIEKIIVNRTGEGLDLKVIANPVSGNMQDI